MVSEINYYWRTQFETIGPDPTGYQASLNLNIIKNFVQNIQGFDLFEHWNQNRTVEMIIILKHFMVSET